MIFLGIDGGGSKTAFLLEDDAGQQLFRIETGPSNWISAGSEVARQSIASGILQLPVVPNIVCGGFAGAGRPQGAEFYQSCLQSLLPQARIFVETDAIVSYAGAMGIEPGVLLIAGTGSIALARQSDGTMHRIGGWGPAFSDEGSGFWMGSEAIRAALRAQDTETLPAFVSSIEQALNLESIAEVVGGWNSGTVNVRSIASLATLLFTQYPAEPAGGILREAAGHLRRLTENAMSRSKLPSNCAKSVTGSVGTHSLLRELIGLNFSWPVETPERGAILWARARMKHS